MWDVELAVAVGVVVIIALVAVWALRRRGGDDVHSVERHRHTIDTLQGIRTRTPGASVRVIDGGSSAPPADDEGPRSPAALPGVLPVRHEVASGAGPLHVDDAAGANGEGREPTRRTERKAISAMNRRPRRVAAPLASAIVVVAVVAALIAVGARQRHPAASHATTTAPTHSTAPTTTPTTGVHTTVSSTHTTARPPHTSTHHKTTVTTTTLPAAFAPTGTTATTATYAAPAPTFSLTVGATTGSCWVLVSDVSSGKTLFTGTLTPGQQQSVQATGTTTIEIGAPSVVAVTLDHTPVTIPALYQTPFTMTLAAPAPAPTTTVPPATAPTTG